MATFERMLLARKHVVINERYNVIRKIGGGSFGDIFLGINVNDGEVNNISEIDFSLDKISKERFLVSRRPCISGFLFLKMAVWAYFLLLSEQN